MTKRIALALVVVMIVTVPAYAQSGQVTQDDLAQAAENRKQASLQLADATAEYEAALVELVGIEDSLARLAGALTERERDLALTKAEARQVAQSMYMNAGVGQLSWFSASSITEFRLGEGYLDRAALEGQATLSRLVAVRQSYIDQQKVLDETLSRQIAATSDPRRGEARSH